MLPRIIRPICITLSQFMILLSVLFFLRGHNHPGGGFIGGLIATTGVSLNLLCNPRSEHVVEITLKPLMLIGSLCLVISLIFPLCFHDPLLTSKWLSIHFTLFKVKIGTPLLFDLGVYCLTAASFLMIIEELLKHNHD